MCVKTVTTIHVGGELLYSKSGVNDTAKDYSQVSNNKEQWPLPDSRVALRCLLC